MVYSYAGHYALTEKTTWLLYKQYDNINKVFNPSSEYFSKITFTLLSSFPSNKMSDLFKLKALPVFDTSLNLVQKGENASCKNFLL